MSKIIIVLLIIFAGGVFAIWDLTSAPPGSPAPISEKQENSLQYAPEVTFTDINENTIDLYSLKGKPVLLNIWATWCTPCIAEMPQLLELAERYKDDITFIALSTDQDIPTIRKFFDRLPETVRPITQAPNVIFAHDPRLEISKGAFGTSMYPETFIIAPDMRIIKKIEGVTDWLGEDVKALLFNAEKE